MVGIVKYKGALLFAGAFYIVKGDGDDDSGCDENSICDTVAASINETHPVRCCSDVEIEGWKKKESCSLWSEIYRGDECKNMTWSNANNFCATRNETARLCTLEELEAGCAEKTGCGFDKVRVWSKTAKTLGGGKFNPY